jgi:hypothetical protein
MLGQKLAESRRVSVSSGLDVVMQNREKAFHEDCSHRHSADARVPRIWGTTGLQAFFQEHACRTVSVITKNFGAGEPAARIESMGIHQQGSTLKFQRLAPVLFSVELGVLNQQIGNAVPAGLWHDVHVLELGIAFLQNQNATTNSNFIHSGYKDTDVTCKR